MPYTDLEPLAHLARESLEALARSLAEEWIKKGAPAHDRMPRRWVAQVAMVRHELERRGTQLTLDYGTSSK